MAGLTSEERARMRAEQEARRALLMQADGGLMPPAIMDAPPMLGLPSPADSIYAPQGSGVDPRADYFPRTANPLEDPASDTIRSLIEADRTRGGGNRRKERDFRDSTPALEPLVIRSISRRGRGRKPGVDTGTPLMIAEALPPEFGRPYPSVSKGRNAPRRRTPAPGSDTGVPLQVGENLLSPGLEGLMEQAGIGTLDYSPGDGKFTFGALFPGEPDPDAEYIPAGKSGKVEGAGAEIETGDQTPQKTAPLNWLQKFARDKLGMDEDQRADLARALMVGGFATMAGDSPYAMQNIGKGGLAGVEAYYGSKDQRRKEGLEEEALRMKRELHDLKVKETMQALEAGKITREQAEFELEKLKRGGGVSFDPESPAGKIWADVMTLSEMSGGRFTPEDIIENMFSLGIMKNQNEADWGDA